MDPYAYIKEFQKVLAGWTIVEIGRPTSSEGLCQFHLRHPEDGRRQTVGVGANDLGAWVEWVRDGKGYYQTFEQLAWVAGRFLLDNPPDDYDVPYYTFERKGSVLTVSAPAGGPRPDVGELDTEARPTPWRIDVGNIEDKWRWVLDPDSRNDPTSWFLGFTRTLPEEE